MCAKYGVKPILNHPTRSLSLLPGRIFPSRTDSVVSDPPVPCDFARVLTGGPAGSKGLLRAFVSLGEERER